MKDVVAGLVLAGAMVVLLLSAQGLPEPRYEPLGAIFLALAVPALTLLLSVFLLVRGALGLRRNPPAFGLSHGSRLAGLRILSMLVLMAVWVGVMQGETTFRWATAPFIIASALALGVPLRLASLVMLLAVALVLSFGVDFVFRSYLDVILP